MERLAVDMVIQTKDILDEYDLDKALEDLDFAYCLPEWFWLSYEWQLYQKKRNKILKEIKTCLSEDTIRYNKS